MELNLQGSSTRTIAKNIKKSQSDIDDEIKHLNQIIDNINASWGGDDATKFISSFRDNVINDLNKLSNVLEEYSEFVENAVGSYEALDSAFVSKQISV